MGMMDGAIEHKQPKKDGDGPIFESCYAASWSSQLQCTYPLGEGCLMPVPYHPIHESTTTCVGLTQPDNKPFFSQIL